MEALKDWDATHHQHIAGFAKETCGTDGLVGARNQVVRHFLSTELEWLWWVDTDMGFQPDTVDRLLEAADPGQRPIVGALTFANRGTGTDGFNGQTTSPTPVIYDAARSPNPDDPPAFMPRADYARDAVVQCSATGSAAVLIHRSVFEKVADRFGPCWYDKIRMTEDTLTDGGRVFAEDLSLCIRAYEVGCPTHVHTGVKTTHHKELYVGEPEYLAASWPPPAEERCAVIVPVLHRPKNVHPFMASLKASTSLATAYFVCEPNDTTEQDEVRKHGGKVLLHPGTFAKKANHGYRNTTEPWMLLVGDDVMFRPGWLDRALRAASGDRFSLVGTNDMSGLARDLATHPLVRRSWVDEHGASWDGPGVMCHEGYGHCFVDNEWTEVAKRAGVFIQAPDAVIEHFHPIFGKAADDPIYRKGYSTYDADQRLFHSRLGRAASIESYPRQWSTVEDMVKIREDLERYARIIAATKPTVIVECGTWSGRSAAWFAGLGPEVVTIDIENRDVAYKHPNVTHLTGSSTDPAIIDRVVDLVDGRRCMVVLDSDHSQAHVAVELDAYADLVTPGCYLVVEDTICRYVAGSGHEDDGPLDAVEQWVPDHPEFITDKRIEALHPATHHPDGWLLKRPEVVDAFLYNGEATMADLRVQTLGDHVDKQVAVVCDLTHQGEPNPIPATPDGCDLHVIHAEPIPEGRGGIDTPYYQWVERQHRRFTIGGGAVVMVSDVDEIPDPATLDDIICGAVLGPVAVPMRMHGFALDWLYPSDWVGTTASTAMAMDPQGHRDARYRLPTAGRGWHLSWMGDSAERRRKLDSFSHAELRDELDVEAAHREGIHANGEHMVRVDVADLDWPAPMFDSFAPPETWRSRQEVAA